MKPHNPDEQEFEPMDAERAADFEEGDFAEGDFDEDFDEADFGEPDFGERYGDAEWEECTCTRCESRRINRLIEIMILT